MLSEERIREIAKLWGWFGDCDGWTFKKFEELSAFARAIEREANRAGQESMRERAAQHVNVPYVRAGNEFADAIRTLPIEEPK